MKYKSVGSMKEILSYVFTMISTTISENVFEDTHGVDFYGT